MKILDSASVFNKKSKKEVKGKGIEFTHTDFTIKIGEFKKNAKNFMIFYVSLYFYIISAIINHIQFYHQKNF